MDEGLLLTGLGCDDADASVGEADGDVHAARKIVINAQRINTTDSTPFGHRPVPNPHRMLGMALRRKAPQRTDHLT